MTRSYLLGLIGEGIGSSLTPPMHEAEAAAHGVPLVYRTLDLAGRGRTREDIGPLLRQGAEFGFDAFNITHPFKQQVIEHLDAVEDEAVRIGAVNTVHIREGRLIGRNTDAAGFALGFVHVLGTADLEHVVQLGAGGAGAAIAHALVDLGARRLTVADPDQSRAADLCARLGEWADVDLVATSVTAAPDAIAHATGLVNASPVGMHHHPGSPVSPEALRPEQWVADAVYRPTLTELVLAARRRGCRTMAGGHMAAGQAAATFDIVTGLRPDLGRMRTTFDRLVEAEQAADVRTGVPPGARNER